MTNNSYDLLTIGDISMDIFMRIDEENLSTVGAKTCFIHGNKIPVSKETTNIAGNSINVAVAAAKLGLSAAVYAETGNDENYERTKRELTHFGVATQFLNPNEGTETDMHPVIVWGGERTIFSYHSKRTYAVKDWGSPSWIYYTSISEGFEKFQKQFVEYKISKPTVVLAFSPGTYHIKAGVNGLHDILSVTDVLFLNKEEAQALTTNEDDIKELHAKLQKLGPKLTVITDGNNGASASDGKSFETTEAFKIDKPILDKTGAGDAFAGAFLSALHHKKSLPEALAWGAKNSACQITEIGGVLGLLTQEQIEAI